MVPILCPSVKSHFEGLKNLDVLLDAESVHKYARVDL